MKAGLAVTVAPQHRTLSTQEAAGLLRISRTTLVRLLETGEIPFDKPSRHRKVRLDDLLEYRRPSLCHDKAMRTKRFAARIAADPRGHAVIAVPFDGPGGIAPG